MDVSGSKGQADLDGQGQSSSKKVKKVVDPADDIGNDGLSPGQPELLEPNDVNPFMIDLVLKVLMSQMTIEDLKRSRGVCQLWDEYSTLELQKLTCQMKPLVLTEAGQLEKFVETFEESPCKLVLSHEIRSILQVMASQEPSFLQSFEPKSLRIETTGYEYTEINSQLLKILQNSSKHIKKFRVRGFYEQLNEKIDWPDNLTFPELEELNFVPLLYDDKDIEAINFFKNVTKNASKLTSLKIYGHPKHTPLCDLLQNNGLIGKLQELEVYYCNFGDDGDHHDLIFTQDLLQIAQAGLKLSKFSIFVNFDYPINEVIHEVFLDYLDNLKEFLTIQSDTLVNLKILIGIGLSDHGYDYICKLTIPPLPKLEVLEIGNIDMCYGIPYNPIDLPSTFPNLREIIIETNSDFADLLSYRENFKGSLETLEKLRIKQEAHYSMFKNFKERYQILKSHFPNVMEFEVDHVDEYKLNLQYRHIPWRNLKKLILHPPSLENLKFGALSHLKGLIRLELINTDQEPSTLEQNVDFDLNSLSKKNGKSIKIQNYLINEKVIQEIRGRFTLDYIPPKSAEFLKN